MILGTGLDIIEIPRIAAAYEKFGARFTRRILHPAEIEYCEKHARPAPLLAARFAAKEAISKAFGPGIGQELGWQDLGIRRSPTGAPYVVLHGAGEKLFAARNARHLWISLTHSAQYAAATATLEG